MIIAAGNGAVKMNEKLKLCPFCGHRIIEKITSGLHFYECENPDCGACISFVGKKDVYKRQPVYTGTKGTDTRGCYIKAVTKSGEVLTGTEVTIAMAKAEGWLSNSKWKNMPEQMLAYRAAAFFARVYCPEVLMGVSVEGEVEDTVAKIEKAPDPFGGKNE